MEAKGSAPKRAGKPSGGGVEARLLLRAAVLGVALVSGLVAWLATREGGGGSPVPSQAQPRIVSAAELAEVAASSGNPVYWAGPMPGKSLELTEAATGPQVRYVPAGAGAGGGPTEALTIGSYPLADPGASLRAFASRPSAIVRRSGGREIATSAARPTSVYFASPDNRVEVEVYDPSPRRAMALALSDRVRPVP